jgi:hypothetical protein
MVRLGTIISFLHPAIDIIKERQIKINDRFIIVQVLRNAPILSRHKKAGNGCNHYPL